MNRYRQEYKYLLDCVQESILLVRASGILGKDPHALQDGGYLVRSLYFDDYDDTCLFENESGTDCRSKFRLRYYNDGFSKARLEKKSKVRGRTLKEACMTSEEESLALMSGEIPDVKPEMSEEKRRMFMEMRIRRLVPKVIVSYDRIPFVYGNGSVRITFDKNITSSHDIGSFLDGDYASRPILSQGNSILEVKWDDVLPLHIKDVLGLDTLAWTAFSKYYMCRTYHL
ncbi:MAG: polyphosphate polymerase domain-containing protein [Lachnospiraceae bacterium]|nr:polyphosphate polymerase domain-containing protein [Lachnospiraceae bacterium]